MIKGTIVIGKIKYIYNNVCIVDIDNKYKGKLHISKISDYYIPKINSIFKVGNEYYFLVLDIDKNKNMLELDWKSIHPRFLRNPFKHNIQETNKNFETLKINIEKGETW